MERTRILTSIDHPVVLPTIARAEEEQQKQDRCVVYWMQRDVRTIDNWALLFAAHLAQHLQIPLRVLYVLKPTPVASPDDNTSDTVPPDLLHLPITERYGTFLLGGLEQVYEQLCGEDAQLGQ